MITIRYIFHDCFTAETPEATLVFDFWTDPTADKGETPRFIREADPSKPLYIIVSHHHKDHFNRIIFDWTLLHPDIRFIISRDTAGMCRHILSPTSIYRGIKPAPEKVTILCPGETFEGPGLNIKAFGSTDIGNSYLAVSAGKTIFHAGDLNAWIWKDESTPEEVDEAISNFEHIVEMISDHLGGKPVDAAMFPVDSRIGTDYFTGARIFCRHIFCRHFFPMHFGLGNETQQLKYQQGAMRFDLYADPVSIARGTEYIALALPYSLCILA